MGDRKWYMRYRDAREYADQQAKAYWNGDTVDTYRGITGAAWVAEAYDIAAENATSLMQVEGALWQPIVDECKRLAQEYREEASHPA
ncbi:MAG: hypothetical protein ACXVBU_18490 [Ktedonobacteraceae bacterium]